MENNATPSPSGRSRLLTASALAILCLCAAFIVWREAAHHRFTLEPDSVAYLSAADRLWHEHQYARYDGDPAPDWPPLTSLALIVPLMITRSPLAAFALLNSLCFAALLLLSWAWLSRHVRSRPVVWCALALLLTALPMRHVIAAGYSEPLFAVLALASLMRLEASATTKAGGRGFVRACVLAGLACLTRYLGVTVIAAGCVLLLLQSTFPWRVRWLRAFTFAGTALLPLGLWCLRNHAVTGTYMGFRDPSEVTLVENLRVTWAVLGGWFLSGRVLGAALAAATLLALYRWRSLRPALLPLAFIVIYAAALMASASHVDMDEIDSRLLFPVFVPVIWAFAQIVDAASDLGKRAAWGRLSLAGAGWAVFCVLVGGYGITAHRNADGYNGQEWAALPWARLRAMLPPDAPLHSNDPPACYLFLHRSADWMPAEDEDLTTSALRQDLGDADGPGFYLWFDPTLSESDENIDAADKSLGLTTLWRGPHAVLLAIPK